MKIPLYNKNETIGLASEKPIFSRYSTDQGGDRLFAISGCFKGLLLPLASQEKGAVNDGTNVTLRSRNEGDCCVKNTLTVRPLD